MSTAYSITKEVSDIGTFLTKPTQVIPIEEIGGRKCAPLQHLVNIFTEKKEMTGYKTGPATRMKNCRPESAPTHFPHINQIINTSPDPTNPPSRKSNKRKQE